MVLFTITYIDFGLYCLVHADLVLIKDNIQSDSVLVFAKAILKKIIFIPIVPPKGEENLQVYFFKQTKLVEGRMSNLISSLFVTQLMLQIHQDFMLFGGDS